MEFYTSSFARKERNGKSWRKCLKYQEDGVWRTVSKRAVATSKRAVQKEAEEWRQEMNAEHDARSHLKPVARKGPGIKLKEYIPTYLKMRAADVRNPITPETLYDYEKSSRDIVNPDGGIADIALIDLNYDDIEAWETWMLSSSGKGLATSTAIKRHALLKAALTQAVVDKLIPHNPMEGLKRPKKVKDQEINALMPDSMAKLRRWIAETEPTPFATAVAIAFCVGLRRQECAALRWKDVDFSNGIIRVRHAIGKFKGGERVKDLKNHESRIVPLTDPLRDVLTRRLARVRSDLTAVGLAASVDGLYICGDIDGSYGRMWSFTKKWKTLREVLGLDGIWRKEVVFHDLRHSFATYAVNSGEMDIVTIARILGHKDTSVTFKWYSATLPSAVMAAAPKIARALDVGNPETPQYLVPGDF